MGMALMLRGLWRRKPATVCMSQEWHPTRGFCRCGFWSAIACTNSSAALAPLLQTPAAIAVAVNRGARVINMSLLWDLDEHEDVLVGLECWRTSEDPRGKQRIELASCALRQCSGWYTVTWPRATAATTTTQTRTGIQIGKRVAVLITTLSGCLHIFSKVYDGKEYVDARCDRGGRYRPRRLAQRLQHSEQVGGHRRAGRGDPVYRSLRAASPRGRTGSTGHNPNLRNGRKVGHIHGCAVCGGGGSRTC